jgi:thiosulfate/3-mercaptopyruvate sulfurtransferase
VAKDNMGPRPARLRSDASGAILALMGLVSPEQLGGCLLEGRPIRFDGRGFMTGDVRVVDVRWYLGRPGDGRRAYEVGHIPGASYLDVDSDLVAPSGPGRHPLPAPAAFAARLSQAGIGDEDLVVAYDDVGGWVAARLWWMLDDLGHSASAVLDGGIDGWIAAHLPLSTEEPDLPPAHLRLADRWRRVIDRDSLRVRLGGVALLDARAGERYRGETEPNDPVPGHIPTALSAPVAGNMRPDGHFLPAVELAERFRALGADRGEVVTSCGSGVTACHNALALRIAGLPDPLLYDGSYSDWSTAGYPIATGAEPGEPPDR